jgi:hypothetical protein
VRVLAKNQSLCETFPEGGLVYEERGAGSPVGAGADESALLRLLEPAPFQFASLRILLLARTSHITLNAQTKCLNRT